jgi:Bifunctional DNA primase/polymerase, N-terminal
MSAAIASALGYTGCGLPVLPIWWCREDGSCACGEPLGSKHKPGKHPIAPLVPHGVKNATLDQRTIESWWRRYPLANVAIASGGNARLVVVDIDATIRSAHQARRGQ